VPLIGQSDQRTDEDLMREVLVKKNHGAFHELVRRHQGLAFYARREGMGEREAIDLVAKKTADCIHSYRILHGEQFVKVLTTSMQNAAKDYRRSRSRKQIASLSDDTVQREVDGNSFAESAEDDAITTITRDELLSVIESLPNSHERIVLMSLVEGKSSYEIAQDQRRSPKWVDNQYQRAKKHLQMLLPREQWAGRAKHHRRTSDTTGGTDRPQR
jgi:RNA polymerase sigma factor (sigma-70 family)